MAKDRWRNNRRPYTPKEVREKRSGLRPSVAHLVEKLDPESESFARTAAVLVDMAAGGIEINAAAIDIAIKLAAQQQARDADTIKANRELAPRPLRLWGEQDGRESIVYYIRRGELIKIGTTTNPKRRFESLMPDEILAWEPGGTLEEALRHRQFRRLRQGLGEYFQIAPDLLKHCKTLRTLHGDPNADWPTTASVGRGRHRRATLPSELPLPRSTELATAAQASRLLGISDSTIRYWIASKAPGRCRGR